MRFWAPLGGLRDNVRCSCSAHWKVRIVDFLIVLLLTELFSLDERRTDGQTDSFLIASPRWHSMQRGKNKHGDQTSIDVYRGITLTPVTSKLFEAIGLLLVIYENSLYSDPLQFGFKKNTRCSHALFGFTEAVRCYRKSGNKVLCAFLDASKAFDKVLLSSGHINQKNVPLPLVRVL